MSETGTRFPVRVRLPILWGDMDALAHVNNTVYFRHFESARIAYFERVGMMERMERDRIGPILAAASCQFKVPVCYPDTVEVQVGVSEIRHTSFTMSYRTLCDGGTRLAAEGTGVVVMYDYGKQDKTPIPEEIRKAINLLEGAS